MGNTPNQDPPVQDHVTTSASNMEKILSDDNNTPKSQFNYASQQRTTNQYVQSQPSQQSQQSQTQQPQQAQAQQYPFVNNNQSHQPNTQQYPNVYGYQPQQPITQTITPQPITSNPISSNPSPHQLQIQLNQQMQQLRLLQQAQQLERQRLDLARQQRNLEAQQAASQQLERQHEIIRMQQQQQQQEQQRLQLQQQQAQLKAKQQQAAAAQQQQESQQESQQQQEEEEEVVVERIVETTDEKYPVIFHWSHGGRDVYVAYSGDNWSQKYRMHRSHNDFSLIMEIQPGVYHYKFIVDNQWRCAPDQKHVRDANGAYSNVLDVRSHSYQQVIDEKKRQRKREKQKAQYQYTQNLPKSDHYVQDPPICPSHLHKVILNNDANNKNNNKKINTMQLPKPLRVSLNHLYVSDKREEEVVTLGITERYKDKFFTTVYYTPIDSRGTMESTFQVSNNYY